MNQYPRKWRFDPPGHHIAAVVVLTLIAIAAWIVAGKEFVSQ